MTNGCAPKGLADYQKCLDGRSFCKTPGEMCISGKAEGTYSCTSRFRYMQKLANHNAEVREKWRKKIRREMQEARKESIKHWAIEGTQIAGQAGVDVTSGAATDVLAPGWGGYIKGGAQAITDVGIGEKTWSQARQDYAVDATVKRLGLSTPKTIHKYYMEYKKWWGARPF